MTKMTRVALVLMSLGSFVVLPLLASVSLPDPIWIMGVYDDADYDDIVQAVTSTEGALPAVALRVAPFLVVVAVLSLAAMALAPAPEVPALQIRGPPIP